jgi:regulator of RNase E activity RraA
VEALQFGTIERPSAALLEPFRGLPTSTLSDVLDALGISKVILNLKPCRPGIRFAGPAVTVKGVTALRGTYPAEEYALGRALDTCQPGDVLVQDIGGERISCLGGVAAFAAQRKQLAGALLDGGARDIDEINECGFSVIARHFVPIGAKTRIRLVGCNVPVTVDGVGVMPGDIVVADSSAVVVVPRARAAEVAAVALECCRNDELAKQAIGQGMSFTEVFRKFPKM